MALPEIPPLRDSHTGTLADLLDWSVVLADTPTVIGTKTGRLQTTLRYTCPDTTHLHPTERASYLARLHEVLSALTEDWALDADWWHEPALAYPEACWSHPVEWLVDEARRLDFETTPRYESTAYLTLSWQPPRGHRRWLQELFLTTRTRTTVAGALDQDIARFQQGISRFHSLLEAVVQRVELLDADATCTYLHQCLSWARYAVRCPAPATDLDWQLSDTPFLPGQPPRLGTMLLQPLTIASWQQGLGTWLPEALAALPFPARFHVRWVPLGTQAAAHFLHWEEKRWAGSYRRLTKVGKMSVGIDGQDEVAGRDTRADAIAAGQSLLQVQDEVLLGQEVLGLLTPTVLCWAEDTETLSARVRALQTVLFHHGLVARVEEAGASLAWLASLPGHVALGTRARALRTQELTALLPHSSIWSGPERNAHLDGPPVLVASTESTPFRLSTHVGELGHMLLVGPTRSGKSGFLGLLTRQWFRYPNARLCIFDRDHALKTATVLGGGAHYALGTPKCSGFHVLGAIDTTEEQQWALTWLEAVLTGEGLAPTPEEREEVWTAVQRLAGLQASQRTLSMYQRLMQCHRLKIGLDPFCTGGPYSFFDATEDAFSLEARLVCFEMSTLLHQPRAIGPALAYIFHRLETAWFTGAPVQIIIDEAKWLLDTAQFLGELEVWLKARAKKNVCITLSTQEIYDVQRTDAWQAVQASVPTMLFLPNAAALRPEVRPFYESLGVGETEIQLLAQAQPLRDYLYRSPLGTRLFQLRLSPLERVLCAASRPEELQVLAELVRETTPATVIPAWLRHWSYHEEATLLETLQKETPNVDNTPLVEPGHHSRSDREYRLSVRDPAHDTQRV